MSWAVIGFGKFKNQRKSLPEIIFEDPEYFLWGIEEGVFYKYTSLAFEAEDLYDKIKRIKIPASEDGGLVVEYLKSQNNLVKTIRINSTDANREVNVVERTQYIDLTSLKNHNSQINCLLPQLLNILFNGSKPSKETCEEYFLNEENFGY